MTEVNNDVYTIDECILIVAGLGLLPVSSFTLMLRHNGIPALRATIDPLHTADQAGPGVIPDAATVAMAVFVRRYLQLQQIINSDSRSANFICSITAHNALDGARDQRLALNGWLVTGVGFESAASGGLSMYVEIRHPAHKLYESSANFFGVKVEETIDPATFESAPNVLEGIKIGMDEYYNRVSGDSVVETVKNDSEFKIMLKEYQEARQTIDQNLEWKAPDCWPIVPFPSYSKEIKYCIWQYINATGDSTYWSWLSNSVCNDWHLSIIPRFWMAKLHVRPTRFWNSTPDLILFDTSILDFQLPPADPAPLRGIYMYYDVPENSINSVLNSKVGMQHSVANAAIYAEPVANSTFMPCRVPAWINSLLKHRGGQFTNVTEQQRMLTENRLTSFINAEDGTGGIGTPPLEDIAEIYEGLKLLCKQQFTEFYRVGMEISVRTTLMLQDDQSKFEDNYVTAGMSVRIKAKSKFWREPDKDADSELLDFYCVEVTHHVDCIKGEAYSMFRGNCMRERPSGPANIAAIPSGNAPNYIYNYTN